MSGFGSMGVHLGQLGCLFFALGGSNQSDHLMGLLFFFFFLNSPTVFLFFFFFLPHQNSTLQVGPAWQ